MSNDEKNLASRAQEALEHRFYKSSFKEIKESPFFSHLNITDRDLHRSRECIKLAWDSCRACGSSETFCSSLDKHFRLYRNADGQLCTKEFRCDKKRDIKNMLPSYIDSRIQQYNSDYRSANFTFDEVQEIIKHCEETNKLPKLVSSAALGDPKHQLKSFYCASSNSRELWKILAFHACLVDIWSIAIRSSTLKKLLIAESFNNLPNEKDYRFLRDIKSCSLLIILDFGIEDSTGKNAYFMDLIPDLISSRHFSRKVTCVFSCLSLDKIAEDIRENNFYESKIKFGRVIHENRLEYFRETMEKCLSIKNVREV